MLLALGPLIGLALAPSPDTLTVVAAVGAAVLAAVGVVVERAERADRLTMAATVIAAAVAVIAGARFGPTGVDALDVVFAFCFIVVVTEAADGLGNVDGLATGIGAASAAGLFALAGFGGQDDLATVALGLLASCFAFLAFNLRPASLFVGRAGRLAIGYTLAVGVLAVHVVPERAARAHHAADAGRGPARRRRWWWPSTGSAAVTRSARTGPTISCTGWARSAGRRAKR